MRYAPQVLLLTVGLLVTARVCPAHEPVDWIERVLGAAPYLPGRWFVDGAWGEERWQGELSCRLIPGQWTYWITCTSRPQQGVRPASITRLSGYDLQSGRSIDVQVAPSLPPKGTSAGRVPLVGQPHVRRDGPDLFVWESATSRGTPLVLTFRRIHETARPFLPAEAVPEEVPARSVE